MRIRLYHKTSLTGQVFTDAMEHDQALQNGWVDAPWKVGEVPEPEVKKAAESLEANPPIEEPAKLKPWQIAQAARKAKGR